MIPNNKLIFLIESSNEAFEEMRQLSADKKPVCLCAAISMFSDKPLMLIKCSGRESVMSTLGDEYSEMIIVLSSSRTSRHYIENVVDTFRDFVKTFFKETIEYGTVAITQS
jgi:hypothetical protein